MTIQVFPIIRQARFQSKRVAMKTVYLTTVTNQPDRAIRLLRDTEAEIEATLRCEGVPAEDRRTALATYRVDLHEMIRRNGGGAILERVAQ
jgi:hypothetical protein